MQRAISQLVRHGQGALRTQLLRKAAWPSVGIMFQQPERWKYNGNGGSAVVKGVKGLKGRKFNVNQKQLDADDEDADKARSDGDAEDFNIDDRFRFHFVLMLHQKLISRSILVTMIIWPIPR